MNNILKLSKKNITRMLDKSFREKILKMYKKDDLLINEYAWYVVDSTIMSRDK